MATTDSVALITAGIAGGISILGLFVSLHRTKKIIKASQESAEKANEVSMKLGEMSFVSQGKQRLIDTVSAQRIEWINEVREKFSELSRLTYIMALKRQQGEKIPNELRYDLTYIVNHIELFLNPTEKITEKLIQRKDRISSYLLDPNTPFDWDFYEKEMLHLHFIEQVILKAEWRRLKIETKNGEEVDDMEEIHRTTAEKIDYERYKKLLEHEYDKVSSGE